MPLVTLNEVAIAFRGPPLLDHVNCRIEMGQKIGLLGRNGAGKTTLMKMLMGETQPDHGDIIFDPGATIAFLPQDIPRDLTGSLYDIVAGGVTERPPEEEWISHQEIEQVLSRMDLPIESPFESLSSGMKRRVLLGRAIVSQPSFLLLDEPTNHLDIAAIDWLEKFLTSFRGTLLFVTHDRMFLRKLAGRILEIDRGQIFDWSCDYDTFLARKEAAFEAEEKQNALFDKKLAEEEVWIRQGIKARRTRNMGRVRALKELRNTRADRRTQPGQVRLEIQQGQRSGMMVAEVEKVGFSYDEREIVSDFSTTILRGDKIGLIGRNGVGKTTLLRILLGQLTPQTGKVKLGTNLEIAYFDQQRQQLDENKTVQENVGDGYDNVGVGDQKQHIIGYLQNFLFTPERARTPVRFLSGGERNRVLLAKLFAKPANVIVLDEPTNDLDAETLEMLEERLVEYKGTVLLVSHDREFLNNVVGSTIVFEEDAVREYVGGYDDWQRQRNQRLELQAQREKEAAAAARPAKTSAPAATPVAKRKLKFKEQQELAALPAKMEKLEQQIAAVHEKMGQPTFYQESGEKIAQAQKELKELEMSLEQALLRWEELEQF
ncbi:ATP-binding cassette domain-containing protein [Lignipirellula cremea]|uniref:ATP-binding protein Uup n=1 Tax=Lignipirellula cremea TaxID=2528010 RepID=A0A518DUT4_9BACT|nr:ATP-binding cassette domain-containing protein [Lignipirellula cremea]QDU95600.1 ABC transporter ATP-binding protein uup [Lignipirellula cremea]